MTTRTLMGRLLSPAGFGLILIFFLFPFVAISCDTQRGPVTASFTGMDMVIGGQPHLSGPGIDAADQADLLLLLHQNVDAEPVAVIAAVIVFLGMAAGVLRARLARHTSAAVLAVAATALLVAAESRAIARLQNLRASGVRGIFETPPTGTTSPRYGFWLALSLLVTLGIAHGVGLLRARRCPDPPVPDGVAPDVPDDVILSGAVPPEAVVPDADPAR
jgi:hypothetical protein